MAVGEGRGDSMDREKIKKKRKEGKENLRKRVPPKEGRMEYLLGGEDRCSWLAPSYWKPVDICHDNCPGHVSGEPLISLSMSSGGPSQGVT